MFWPVFNGSGPAGSFEHSEIGLNCQYDQFLFSQNEEQCYTFDSILNCN